jgi:hypothetical protein
MGQAPRSPRAVDIADSHQYRFLTQQPEEVEKVEADAEAVGQAPVRVRRKAVSAVWLLKMRGEQAVPDTVNPPRMVWRQWAFAENQAVLASWLGS